MPMPKEQADATLTGNASYSVYDLALCRSGKLISTYNSDINI